MPTHFRGINLTVLAVLVAFGCTRERAAESGAEMASTAAPTPNVVTFHALDFAFTGPAQIPAGLTTLRLVNDGAEPHHMQVVKLESGKTVEDLLTAVATPGPPPDWVSFRGGPNGIDPGGVANSTQFLEAGQYALLCIIPSFYDGVLHVAKGMHATLEVVATDAPAAAEPTADLVMELIDYGFQLSTDITAGTKTIRVVNNGSQWHEVVIARLAEGKTVADFGAWAGSGFQGEPPASFIGGVVALDAGAHSYFTADFSEGDYLLLCFLPDAKDGKEHIEHGMMKVIHVRAGATT